MTKSSSPLFLFDKSCRWKQRRFSVLFVCLQIRNYLSRQLGGWSFDTSTFPLHWDGTSVLLWTGCVKRSIVCAVFSSSELCFPHVHGLSLEAKPHAQPAQDRPLEVWKICFVTLPLVLSVTVMSSLCNCILCLVFCLCVVCQCLDFSPFWFF